MNTYFATFGNLSYTFRANNICEAIEWPKQLSGNLKWHVGPIALIDDKSDNLLVFEKAVACGFLSLDKDAFNFAPNYMFMGIIKGEVQLKHLTLRNCIKISVQLLNDLKPGQ